MVLKPCRKRPRRGCTTSANIWRPGEFILYTRSKSKRYPSEPPLLLGSCTTQLSGTSTHGAPPFCFSCSSSGRTCAQ